jgi:DNA-binding GntR family transcriptional regulator
LSGLLSRTVKSELVEYLRDEIICGDLVPGQHLRLEEIANRFDVSTMPVREALRDLEAEGIVTIFPHRGAVVTQLSAEDLQDIYEIRATLEEMATRLAVPLITDKTLYELNNVVEQMNNHIGEWVTLVKLNQLFHNTLYAASGRKHLCELTNMLRYRTQHYLHAFITYLGGMPRAQEEHRSILRAIELGQAEQAAKSVHEHVKEVGDAIVEYIRQKEALKNAGE